MKRSGFTLIELLVVIAIIAILAAILFPVFMSAKNRGRQGVCLSNMGQIGKACMMYLGDNDDTYPQNGGPYSMSRNGSTPPYPWSETSVATKILPYARSASIFVCPSDTAEDVEKGKTVSYAPSYWLGRPVSDEAITLGIVTRPSKVVYWTGSVNFGAPYNTIEQHNWQNQFDWGTPTLHNEGMNITFADGHAKWYEIKYPPESRTQQGITYIPNHKWSAYALPFPKP